jgi:predicted DNA-binding transcriptional regulator AlpA
MSTQDGHIAVDSNTRLAWRVNEFCTAVGISRTSFYELVKQDKIRTVIIAGRRLVPDSEVRRLLTEAA